MHQKILIIRFSSIGDLVLTTPVIRCLKEQLDLEIHLLVKKKFGAVLQSNPYIKKIWSIEKTTNEIINELKQESFDLIIDLHFNFRSILLNWKLGKQVIRFSKINIKKWLMTSFKWNRLPDKHIVDRYFESLKKLNIVNDQKGLDFFINEEDSESIKKLELPKKYVVGVLGATYFTKQIPLKKWADIIQSIDLPIILLGGNSEVKIGNSLILNNDGRVLDFSGQFNIGQSAAVIRDAVFIITPDTGMMHIAAALKKPMHVVWGNTIPKFGMYPYFGLDSVIVKNHEVSDLSCRPCSKLGYSDCPKKHFNCMQKQIFNKQTLEI